MQRFFFIAISLSLSKYILHTYAMLQDLVNLETPGIPCPITLIIFLFSEYRVSETMVSKTNSWRDIW